MKKILFGILSFVFLGAGVVYAESNVNQPSTFNLKVGSSAYVSNYQNMKIVLNKTGMITPDTCKTESTAPCPMYARQPVMSANITVSTEGGCGANADSRCLGAPAFSSTFDVELNAEAKALALKIKAVEISNDGATFKVYTSDDKVIQPMPPVETGEGKVIPIGRDFGNRGNGGDDDSTVVTGSGSIGTSGSIIYPITSITICPIGKDDCQVCSGGSCKEKIVPYTEGTATAPGIRKMMVPDDAEIQSVGKDTESTSTPAYKVKAVRKARLFFLFPVNPEINYRVDAKTGSSTEISKPWWNFLAW